MSHPLDTIIEARIQAADARGDLKGLSGEGAPIPNVRDGNPTTLDKIMEGSQVKPAAVVFAEKAQALRRTLAETSDPDQRKVLMARISELDTRANMEREALFRFL